MKSYIVTKQFAGLKEGEVDQIEIGKAINGHSATLAILLALGFIEEEVGVKKEEISHCVKCSDFGNYDMNGKFVISCINPSCECHKVGGEKKEECACRGTITDTGTPHSKERCVAPQPPQNEWRPKAWYWVVASTGEVNSVLYESDSVDKQFLEFGNYFRTESAALRAAEEIRNLLKTLPKE